MKMNILVVDDDDTLRNELAEWLNREGHNALAVESGTAAVEMAKKRDFNLILTDLKMPGMSGIDVLNSIKELKPGAHMVMITAYGTIDTAVEAMKIGADDYLCKPFEMSQLARVIDNISSEIEFENQIKKIESSERPEPVDPFEVFKSMVDDNGGLCITTQNPGSVMDRYHLESTDILLLSEDEDCSQCVHPKNLYDMKLHIGGFFLEHARGAVIFDGIEMLLDQHSWDVVKKFMCEITSNAFREGTKLIITVKPGTVDEGIMSQLKHMISNPYTQMVSESLTSPIRRNTLKYLSSLGPSSFSDILKELDIRDAPKLSFHLKKLVNNEILQKDEKKRYSLTKRGKSVSEFLAMMERETEGDMQNNVMLICNASDIS